MSKILPLCKPPLNDDEIDKFLMYLNAMQEEMKAIKPYKDCIMVLKCDLLIISKRNNYLKRKGGEHNG